MVARFLAVLACASALAAAASSLKSTRIMEDAILSTPQLIKKYGYPVETHTVQTADGYLLETHRIPRGRGSTAAASRPVVYLQHGLLSSSADWVMMGPGKGFAYILADMGFDVWLGNSRGNTYSRKHVTLDPDVDQEAFWAFSWHEMGVLDLPAQIDYILEKTSQKDLFYVGHSQGTTEFFVLGAEKPEYNSKIKAMFSLSSVVFNTAGSNPLLDVIGKYFDLEHLLGLHEFFPHSDQWVEIGDEYCRDHALLQATCAGILSFIGGGVSHQLNETMMPVIIGHTPAGASTRQMLHYTQDMLNQRFAQYDFGRAQNMIIYGTPEPPEYDLSKVTAPVHLYWSDGDISVTEDLDLLEAGISNSQGRFQVPWEGFNHLDYLWGIDVKTLMYDQVIAQMITFLSRRD